MNLLHRRNFLSLAAAGAAAAPALQTALRAQTAKPLRGIFPIIHTPFTEDDKVDFDDLVKHAHYLHRTGVHGMVWPQLASEWASLRPEERFRGAELLVKAANGLSPALVLGMQAPTIEEAVAYARHAEKLAPDAIIAIPQSGVTDNNKLFDYYKAIGNACKRPFFVQALGNMTAEFIVEMSKAIPTLRYVKDEAGPPLPKLTFYREKHPEFHPFTGNNGKTLYEEMLRGSAGTMPGSQMPELYVDAWNHFQAGRHRQSAEACMRTTWFLPIYETYGMVATKYIMTLRGVFKTYLSRGGKPNIPKGGTPLDDEAKRNIQDMLAQLKPWLRA
ncbi:MAG: dihydrodipicolinate synthase family protein [Acidobacteria bacterium]|nr:dihydrodipicolinate synthase family protein [Acidobacteriota bacterium]